MTMRIRCIILKTYVKTVEIGRQICTQPRPHGLNVSLSLSYGLIAMFFFLR